MWERLYALKPYDDLGDLERASVERYGDGWELLGTPRRELGAVYAMGYAVEMTLKCAIYELAGVVPGQDAFRALAAREGVLAAKALRIHDLPTLAANLTSRRAALGLTVDPGFESALSRNVGRAAAEWSVFLRYRHAAGGEADALRMADVAQWFLANRRRMVT